MTLGQTVAKDTKARPAQETVRRFAASLCWRQVAAKSILPVESKGPTKPFDFLSFYHHHRTISKQFYTSSFQTLKRGGSLQLPFRVWQYCYDVRSSDALG